jgi:uncharacterized protein YbjT (DUF2867 family)
MTKKQEKMTSNFDKLAVVMLGASGAVGTETLQKLLTLPNIERLTLLGRTPISGITSGIVQQHKIDVFNAASYADLLAGHQVAICTLGVGQPSKMGKEEFIKIDKTAVLDFAKACKKADVAHFQLLASVGISAKSSSFYLKTKGELVDELIALNFEQLSIFQPSMILTPTNRYGFGQAVTLFVWPLLTPLLIGGWRKYRGIPVDVLGKAIAINALSKNKGVERLEWDEFYKIAG